MKLNGNEVLNAVTCKVPNLDVALCSINLSITVDEYIKLSRGSADFLLDSNTTLMFQKEYGFLSIYKIYYKGDHLGAVILIN
jgi:hypothetical protein